METYKALVVEEVAEKEFARQIMDKPFSDLPDGDVLVRVNYSSLNYKDALSATGHRGVTRKFPHTPGIDAAGVVAESTTPDFKVGDEVIVMDYDLGMNTAGGYGQYIRVPAGWVMKRPDSLSLRETMIYGTAGFTAAMSIYMLMQGVPASAGEVLVTGSTGGVGSMAVAMLSKLGYTVVGVTGKPDKHAFLKELGASSIISREEAQDSSNRPLLKARWAGVIDTVGGDILATSLKSTQYGATVTCCGLVASPELPTTVYPFILRAVRLQGIDVAECPMPLRQEIWQKMTGAWQLPDLEPFVTETGLDGLEEHIQLMLKGQQAGRVVVNLD